MLDLDLIADILSDSIGTGGSVVIFKEEFDALPEEDKELYGPTYDEAEGYIDPSIFPSLKSFIYALNEIVNTPELYASLVDKVGAEDLEFALEGFLGVAG